MQTMDLNANILIAHYERTVAELSTENVRLKAGVEQLQHEVVYLRAEAEQSSAHAHPHDHAAEGAAPGAGDDEGTAGALASV
ncbi:hypothetical protein [Catellatospora vulcania]|uniref:hypothetical protein n=1 Tax=Catellatospora vulcania TaxID=1460450 RepID=UPI0012D38CB5|nr:hypothetical protein [Catellatospora vulcania]